MRRARAAKPPMRPRSTRAGREAVRAVVRKQREAGIDVGNNGEQQRNSFFLYLRRGSPASAAAGSGRRAPTSSAIRNSSGCGSSSRPASTQVSSLGGLPKAIGEVRYLDDRAINDECRHFKAVLDETPGVFVEPFMMRAVARHRRHGGAQRALRHARGLSGGARHGAAGRVPGDRRGTDSCCRSTRPTSRWSATSPTRTSRWRRSSASSSRWSRPSTRRSPAFRAIGSACMCAGATRNRRTTADVPLADILPALQQAKVGGFVLPFANPRHAHEFRCFEKHPLADDQILVAGVIDSLTNFVEHPEVVADRLERVAAVSATPRACWPAPTAASIPRPDGGGSPRTWSGPSSPACATAPAWLRKDCSDRPRPG